jgi:hypothetical protein
VEVNAIPHPRSDDGRTSKAMDNGVAVGTAPAARGPEAVAVSANPVQDQFYRVGHYRWMIIAIAIVAALLSAGYAWTQGTTYTGTSALIVSSGNTNPDADARVAQGYVEYFNQDFAKSSLGDRTALADGVSISAKTSATSSTSRPRRHRKSSRPRLHGGSRRLSATMSTSAGNRTPTESSHASWRSWTQSGSRSDSSHRRGPVSSLLRSTSCRARSSRSSRTVPQHS